MRFHSHQTNNLPQSHWFSNLGCYLENIKRVKVVTTETEKGSDYFIKERMFELGSEIRDAHEVRGGHGNPLQYFCLENPLDLGYSP